VLASEEPRLWLLGADDEAELRSAARALRFDEPVPPAPGPARLRAGFVAASEVQLERRVEELLELVAAHRLLAVTGRAGVFLGRGRSARIGFLFPGQGAPVHNGLGALGAQLPVSDSLYRSSGLAGDDVPPERVQLAVVLASLAGLQVMRMLGIEASLALGHSLGEFCALHWAGAIDEAALLHLARVRGEAMTGPAVAEGAMASVFSDEETLGRIVSGTDVTVACFNSPAQRVVSGTPAAVDEAVARAKAAGARAIPLKVTGAFHSPLMRPAASAFRRELAQQRFGPLAGPVISSVTGREFEPGHELRATLARQIEEPVQFERAAREAAQRVGLLVEVGPGKALAGLVAETSPKPVVSLNVGGRATRPLLEVMAAAWSAGAPVPAPMEEARL
jgi:enediyne polyketide synthase